MKKKVIATAIMVTLLFAGCQSSIQTDTPMPTENPKATAVIQPTEAPVITEEPVATEVPIVSEEPRATEVPNATEVPEVTQEPAITEEPSITEAPVPTEEPVAEPTDIPDVTPTEVPAPTATVAPTATPEPTTVPTSTPVPTNTPVPTPTPKPTSTPKPTATPKPVKSDVSKYLVKDAVREDRDLNDAFDPDRDETGDIVEYWEHYDLIPHESGRIVNAYYSLYKIYELTERPNFAGEPKTVKIKDSELNNKDLMEKGLYVGDTVIIDSYTYEQDGNTSNGKEPIEWKVAYMQILCSANKMGFYYPTFSYYPTGSQITIQYYLVSDKVLDNLRMDEWDDVRLYSGKYDGEHLYEMDTDFTLDFQKYAFKNPGMYSTHQLWKYNVTDLRMAYNQLSLEKGDNISPKLTATKYANNNGIATDTNGICERVWLDAQRSAPDKDEYILDYAWLTLRKDGMLEFVEPHVEAGFLPELTIWAGVDTTTPEEGKTEIKLSDEDKIGKGSDWLLDEDIINRDIWNAYAPFVTWDWVVK